MPITTMDAQKAGLPYAQAEVLSYISHLFPKSKAFFHGQRFTAVTRQQIAEQRNLSPDQVRRSIDRLAQYGLIRVEQHQYKGVTQSFIRPLVDDILGWKKPPAGPRVGVRTGQLATPANGHKATPKRPQGHSLQSGHKASLYKPSERSLKDTERDVREIAHVQTFPENVFEEVSEQIQMGVHDVKASFEAKKKSGLGDALASNKNTVGSLEKIWKHALSGLGEYVPPLTGKDTGNLSRLIKACPEGKAGDVLSMLVLEWDEFSIVLKSEYGAFNLPHKPDLATLTRFIGAGVTFYLTRKKAKIEQAQKDAQKALQPANDILAPTTQKTAQTPSQDEIWGIPVPKGCTVQVQDDELVIRDGGKRIVPPEQKFGQQVLEYGVSEAINRWKASGDEPLPWNPERYFRGSLAAELVQLLAAKAAEA